MNCLIVDDDDASTSILKQITKQVDYLTVVQTCANPLDAIKTLNKENIDLLFLDIEMPEMNGMEMLQALDNKPHVIITTSNKDRALEAFDLNVVDYLIKPVTLPRLLKALTKVKAISTKKDQVSTEKNFFFIKKDAVLNKIHVKDILWIEALGDYITINTKDNRYVLHVTLKAVESKLPASKFVRVHRCYIVHIDNIGTVEDTTIFINETSIPIGAVYRENFIQRLNTLQ
jgi:DNA-binding LytR/AlgR family response regulator